MTKVEVKNTKYQNAMKKALEYSRELPYRPSSPYGYLRLDDQAAKDAFRQCYETIRKLLREE